MLLHKYKQRGGMAVSPNALVVPQQDLPGEDLGQGLAREDEAGDIPQIVDGHHSESQDRVQLQVRDEGRCP